MASFTWPPVGSGGVATYPNFAAFPASAADGTLAVALDTDVLYVFNLGSMTWLPIGAPGTTLAIGPFGSTPNASGLTIASSLLSLQPADATHPGGVSIATQTFGGNKLFSVVQTGTGTVTTAGRLAATTSLYSVGTSLNSVVGSVGYGVSPGFTAFRAQGTEASPTVTATGNTLLFMSGRGFDGTNFINAANASIQFLATENFTSTAHGTEIRFLVTPNLSGTIAERMRIFNDGNISIGNVTSSERLSVTGNIIATGTVTGSNISGINTGDVTLTAVGAVPNANAASLTGQALTLQPADATHPGIITPGTQILAGQKYLNTYLQAGGTAITGGMLAPSGFINLVSVNGVIASVSYSSRSGMLALSANGTEAAPTATLMNDNLMTLAVSGYNGTTFPVFGGGPTAFISVRATENWAPGANGSSISFGVTPNGTASPVNPLYIDQSGFIGINTNATSEYLTVNGNVTASGTIHSTGGFTGNLTGNVTGNVSGTSANVTGIVSPTNGGTGQSSYVTGDIIFAPGTNALAKLSIGTAAQVLTVSGGVPAWVPASTGTVTSITFTGDGTVLSNTPSAPITTSGTVTAMLNTQSANTIFAGPTSGGAAPPTFRAVVSADLSTAAFIAPTVQTFTSSSGTYTTPTSPRSPLYIEVTLVGGGGGGGGTFITFGTAGGTGGNSTFGSSLLAANGGTGGGLSAGSGNTGGAGGTASLGSGPVGVALSGGNGLTGTNSNGGGVGAVTPFGGAGAANVAGVTNSGSGGGGGGSTGSGGGGGAGGYVNAIITAPSATYAYAVGAAGTLGSGDVVSGTAGGSGFIIVKEYYQ